MVETETSKSGVPTLTGGKSLSMKVNTSSTSRTTRYLMSQEPRIKKVSQSLSGEDIREPTRDGRSSILTSQRMNQPRDSTKNLVSTSTDHST
jgi:hypothetical protein